MKAPSRLGSLLAASAFCLAFATARAAPPFSLGGHELGLEYDSVINDPAYDCESLAGCFLFSACAYQASGKVAFKGAPIDTLTLYFSGERLSGIAGAFQQNQFDQVAETLTRDYGPGEAGAGGGSVLLWRQGSKLLRLERSGKTGRSSVIVAERNFISELVEKP